ncbi:MAG: hypothetical protein AB1467_06440 [Candidatus Diapherotrites archaeon]
MGEYFEKPPFDYSPGLAEFLVKKYFSKNSFMASIFRLEDKGAVKLESFGEEFFPRINDEKTAGLNTSELVVLNFLMEWIKKENKRFSFTELKQALSDKYKEFWQKFENALIVEFKTEGLTSMSQMSFVNEMGKEELMKIYIFQFIFFWAVGAFSMIFIFPLFIIFAFLTGFFPFFIIELLFFIAGLFFLYFFLNHFLIMFARDFSIIQFEARIWFNISLFFSFTQKAREHREKWLKFSEFVKNYFEIEKQPAKYHEL